MAYGVLIALELPKSNIELFEANICKDLLLSRGTSAVTCVCVWTMTCICDFICRCEDAVEEGQKKDELDMSIITFHVL